MAHFTGDNAINNNHSTYMEEILDTLYVQLAAHPLINNPPIWDSEGNPIRITKFRNFDGIELQNITPNTLTLSIYPYSYVKDDTSTLTSTSTNASIVYKPHTLGHMGAPLGPTDHCITHIGLKLHVFGYDQMNYTDPGIIENQQTIYQFNKVEKVLHSWAELLRLILTSDLRRLPSISLPIRYLLTNSFVNWINFSTGRWTDDANLVFHTATLLWQGQHYPTRLIEKKDPGTINLVGGLIGYVPNPAAPGQTMPVWYDLTSDRYFTETGQTVTRDQLIDPTTGGYYSGLDTSIVTALEMISLSRGDTRFYAP